MRLVLEDNNKLLTFELDSTAKSYWITDDTKNSLVNVENVNNKWVLSSNNDVKILKDINHSTNETLTNVNQLASIELVNFLSVYLYEIDSKKVRKLYCLPTYDNTMQQFIIDAKTNSFVIGNNTKALINCNNVLFSKEQIVVEQRNGLWYLLNKNTNLGLYLNDLLENNEVQVNNGDMFFIDGFMFSFVGNIIIFNNPNNSVIYDSMKLTKRLLPVNPEKDYSTEQEVFVENFNKSEYFQRPPRFKRSIEPKKYEIVPPMASFIREEMPLIYTLGPMMLMGITSVMSGLTAIMNVIEGKSTFKENATPIITSITMILSMLVFPLLQKLYTKNSIRKKENKRKRKYTKYINTKREQILQEIETQRQILIENNLNLEAVANIVLNKQRNLWERKLEHSDFLEIRIGIGNVTPQVEVNLPGEEFTIEDEDNLKELYNQLLDTVKDMDNVPVTIDLKKDKITGIVGDYNYVRKFLDGFMLNLMAFHSYDMLKLVVFTSNEKKNSWEKYRNIPHFWNNEKNIRFIGIDSDGINKVSNSLMQIYNERMALFDSKDDDIKDVYLDFKDYYLILTDEADYLKNTTIFNELKKLDCNVGFSFVIVTDRIDNLPNECVKFINISPDQSGIFETELISTKQKLFSPDIPNFKLNNCYLSLCNIPIDISAGKYELPKVYSFLEMYNVGNVKHLNILNRWKNNNIIQSLAAPVGIDEQGDLFKIDLHEKFHGPHGLVAGMTGSGKSEWIVTYILSMCINYHPDEVQFVLIDYKGGGLAGTFENKETGIRVPHLAGTITNLDVSEMHRSLASINSELKRRQSLFNQARDKLGESSVDIYKYQKWYRDSRIETPISHLFIISDEFAELKSQQPEFMAELISTARIGRSLGVHLILATQKPSGVVDDQIWSNSKFKVCLKVQDAADSNEMIRIPDAAMIKETGRFFLQVGFNEFFAKGQSAYAGMPYYESDRHKKTIDTDVIFVDNTGDVYKEINSEKKIGSAVFKGEELTNILKEIISVANSENINIKRLWLDAIPELIYVDELLKKYEYTKQNFILNPVIGEYDAPQYQKQALLTLPLSQGGNVLIYGISGSGKEKLLTTMIYSLMITHYAKEVNVYILDFGAEVFNCFKKSPIVGDIVGATDPEKIKNYFKFLFQEFEERKKLFADFNGDYYSYIRNSGKSKPIIVNIINNFENFSEAYGEAYFDILSKLARDGEKYGILFIITANSVGAINFRLAQYFKQSICLQQKDPYDYKSILGNKVNVLPASKKGRGVLLVNGEAFEFQTADPTNNSDLFGYLNALSLNLLDKQKEKAIEIKSLPDYVNYEYVKDYLSDFGSLPVGVDVNNIEVYRYNFLNSYSNIITSSDSDILMPYVKSILELIAINDNKLKAMVFDGDNILSGINQSIIHIDKEFLNNIKNLNEFLDIPEKITCQMLIFITGIGQILRKEPEVSDVLYEVVKKMQDIKDVNIVFVEEVNTLRDLTSLAFFNEFASNENVIFVGNGLDNQYVITLKGDTSDLRQPIPDNFGYVVLKGKLHKIKLLEMFDRE